ncbi:MAG: hypothetical protein IPM51_07505 [Sphingobacteriaceae bacterium]|nr:hypothetical protein [Sphingobacteriaceae bacterium]
MISFLGFSQGNLSFKLDSIPAYNPAISRTYGVTLPERWKYCKGDNLNWASVNLKDDYWPRINTELRINNVYPAIFDGIGWFRLPIVIDSSLIGKPLCLMIHQQGASEIYIDGEKIYAMGDISAGKQEFQSRENLNGLPIYFSFKKGVNHLITIRYSHFAIAKYRKISDNNAIGFSAAIGHLQEGVQNNYIAGTVISSFFIFYFTFFAAIGFLHLLMYFFYKINRSNLYFSIFSLGFGVGFLFMTIQFVGFDPDFNLSLQRVFIYLPYFYISGLLAMLYSIFNNGKLPRIFWIIFTFLTIDFISTLFGFDLKYTSIVNTIVLVIEPLRIVIQAIIKKKDGAWIIGTGIISTIVFFIVFIMSSYLQNSAYINDGPAISLLMASIIVYFTLNIPLAMSIYLARDFARTSKKLALKLKEVEELSAKNLAQEKEKQLILEQQNQILEEKVVQRTEEITAQKKIIEEKNKDITDSIKYARRIQMAHIPSESMIKRILNKLR